MMTAASWVESENDLERIESQHMCPERALAQLLRKESEIATLAQRN